MQEEIKPTMTDKVIEEVIEKKTSKKKKTIIILIIISVVILIIMLSYVLINKYKVVEEDVKISPLRINKTKVIENPTPEDLNSMIETLELNNDNFKKN